MEESRSIEVCLHLPWGEDHSNQQKHERNHRLAYSINAANYTAS